MARKESRSVTQRQLKVSETLRRIIAESLAEGRVYAPDFSFSSVVVSEVRISPDFSIAKVFVAPLLDDKNGQAMQEVLDNMQAVKGQIKKILGSKIRLRVTPELTFLPDDSFAEGGKIEDLLNSSAVKRDLQ